MGERLGTVESLMRQGIAPIALQEGVRIFERLVCDANISGSVVVTGRIGQPPTLKYKGAIPPLARFIENIRVYVPRVELVAEAELTADSDPYLKDHTFNGDVLFPAVFGLEAMAQAVSALRGEDGHFVFENVEFGRPIVVSNATTVRVCALNREDGTVDVALRSSETGFLADHFRASCSLSRGGKPSVKKPVFPETALDASELYGSLLFQTGVFQRVSQYLHMRATECCARIDVRQDESWFARELPPTLLLGDPGARDGAIHSIQSCVPHAVVLPVAVERIEVFAPFAGRSVVAMATERSGDGRTFVYDLDVVDEAGVLVERWEGLRLQALDRSKPLDQWPVPLLANYLERVVSEFIPDLRIRIAFEHDAAAEKQVRRARTMGRLVNPNATLERRPDGKPELRGAAPEEEISFSHSGPLTLAAHGAGEVGCDVEIVAQRSVEMWSDLLGTERMALARLVSEGCGETLDAAATRVWTLMEALAKAGIGPRSPMVLRTIAPGGCAVFASGDASVVTAIAHVQSVDGAVVIAVAGKKRAESRIAA
jgi:enediyne polyketide synthase